MSSQARSVYVSSTVDDLPEYRIAIREAIEQSGFRTVYPQPWSGDPEAVIDRRKSLISDANLLMGIYAYKYGWQPVGHKGQGIIEIEYQWASSIGKPYLCFLVDPRTSWPAGRSTDDPDAQRRMEAFKRNILLQRTVPYFSTPDDLSRRITAALRHFVNGRPLLIRDNIAKLDNLTIKTAAADELTDMDWAYREAASVLTYYDPGTLRPNGHDPADDVLAIRRLMRDSVVIVKNETERVQSLKNEIRIQTLKRLYSRQAILAALSANKRRPAELLQQVFESYVRGEAEPITAQSLEQLECSGQVIEWLTGTEIDVPSADDVKSSIEKKRVFEPFSFLVGGSFRGRQKELSMLRDYVNESPLRSASNVALVIHGPGGMGKSTLVAKFILDYQHAIESQQVPFCYLDFDRPYLEANEPLSLLLEMVQQLSGQFPHIKESGLKLRQAWLRLRAPVQTKEANRPPTDSINLDEIIDGFSDFYLSIGQHNQPFLLVLDTFEQVQTRSRDFVKEVGLFLAKLQNRIPQIRPLIVGRAPVTNLTTKDMRLGELDDESATEFLNANGITDPKLAETVVKQVGGNPLNLKLAVKVVKLEGLEQRDVEAWELDKLLRPQLEESIIQSYLYRRILNHVENPDVRKLAHPGLVVRKITPEVIQQILAEPCGVVVNDAARAHQLFKQLEQEVSLVELTEDGALRHRPDVRQAMLAALRNDEPVKVFRIHSLAARYYHEKTGVANRAEEIYHGLFIEDHPEDLDNLWESGVELYLGSAIDEVPPSARAYLASQLGHDLVDIDDLPQSDSVWERNSQRRVQDLISLNKPAEALTLLAEREHYMIGSPLYLLEAQILEGMKRWPEARRVANDGIYSASQAQNTEMLRNLYVLSARADEQLENYVQAQQMLDEAMRLVADLKEADLKDLILKFEIQIQRLRLCRLAPTVEPIQCQSATDAVLDTFGLLPNTELASYPRLLSQLTAELGVRYADVLIRVLDIIPMNTMSEQQQKLLVSALTHWDDSLVHQSRVNQGGLVRFAGFEEMNVDLTWGSFVNQAEPTQVFRNLAQLFRKFGPSDEVSQVVISILQEQQSPS